MNSQKNNIYNHSYDNNMKMISFIMAVFLTLIVGIFTLVLLHFVK